MKIRVKENWIGKGNTYTIEPERVMVEVEPGQQLPFAWSELENCYEYAERAGMQILKADEGCCMVPWECDCDQESRWYAIWDDTDRVLTVRFT